MVWMLFVCARKKYEGRNEGWIGNLSDRRGVVPENNFGGIEQTTIQLSLVHACVHGAMYVTCSLYSFILC